LELAGNAAATNPEDSDWQHVLAFAWERIGYERQDRNDLAGAATAYERELEIISELSKGKPGDTGLQSDCAESKLDVGAVYRLLGRNQSAQQLLEEAKNSFTDLERQEPLSDYQRKVMARIEKELATLKANSD
jgi:tetratricopeptide (TPR) repeat protein